MHARKKPPASTVKARYFHNYLFTDSMKPTVLDTTPFYKKLAYVLISLIAFGYLAILGKEILSPLLFSMLFSIVLLPLAKTFEHKLGLPRSMAALLALLLFISAISAVFYLVGAQVSRLASDWPHFKDQLALSLNAIQDWIEHHYHVNAHKQLHYIHEATTKLLSSGTLIAGATFMSVSSILLFLVFTTIDIFFLLLYRRLILNFMISVFKEENAAIVYAIVEQVQYIIRKYIIGLLLEMGVVTLLVCAAFWILGIKYAVLLALITGMLNLVPYVGIFTALILSLLITFATAATVSKVLLVGIVLVGVHLIDSNILLPMIVGSKVKINALMTVLGVVVGEMLWGIAGMFLSIPVIAVVKIIFDRIESLQPWGMLLGEESKGNKVTVLKE